MESVGQTMAHRKQVRQFNYEELVKQIVADPDGGFIQSERLTPAESNGAFLSLISIFLNAIDSYWEMKAYC